MCIFLIQCITKDQNLLGNEERNKAKVSMLISDRESFKAKENQSGWKGYFILIR